MRTTVITPKRARAPEPASSKMGIERILVPIDFSPGSLKAMPYALALSKRFDADVYLLHTFDAKQYFSPALLSLAAKIRAESKEQAKSRLQAIALKYQATGRNIHVQNAREGRAYTEICRIAEKLQIDLIVITTHGYTGYRRVFEGSTAERVVQHSHCPVLVLRQDAHHSNRQNGQLIPPGFDFYTILVPTDFSECAKRGFRYAVKLAREFRAKLRLVHIINPKAYPFGEEYAALDAAQLISQARHLARKRMREMGAKLKLRYSVQIEHGSPATEICKTANRNADLIVISTHGRSGLSHVLIGSTAEHVVRYARCPVFVIPARAKPNKKS